MRSFPVAWTTATQFCTASPTTYFNDCSLHVQNAAAMRTGRREHISPVLQELHWLPVRRRVDFKLTTLMFKSLHGCTPSYLSDACKSASEASRRLRSFGAITCVIPWSWFQNSSGRHVVWCRGTAALEQFACFTAVIWQSLPIQKTVENVFCLSRTRLRRLVTLAFRRRI